MGPKEIREYLAENYPEALVVDGHDNAIIGVLDSFDHKDGNRLVYDYDQIIANLTKDGMNEGEAAEFFDFNIIGSWHGEATPVFVKDLRKDE